MEEKKEYSILKLEKMVFDQISFKRLGFGSDEELKFQLKSSLSQYKEENLYRVNLTLEGTKQDEYTFEIILFGFFSFSSEENLDEEMRNALLDKNAIDILFPYLRSEVSILTAQPGMDCVVLSMLDVSEMERVQ